LIRFTQRMRDAIFADRFGDEFAAYLGESA